MFFGYIIYVFTRPLRHGQVVTQSLFFSEVQLTRIQSFPSLRLVAKPKLKKFVHPTIYPVLVNEKKGFHPFFKRIIAKWKESSFVQDLHSLHRFHFLRR